MNETRVSKDGDAKEKIRKSMAYFKRNNLLMARAKNKSTIPFNQKWAEKRVNESP